MKQKLSLIASGKVQGVFFRSGTAKKARKMGLVGFVKNMKDGRLRIIAEGKEKKLKQFEEWVNQGPKLAQVDRVKAKYAPATDEYKKFVVRR